MVKDEFKRVDIMRLTGGIAAPHRGVRVVHMELPVIGIVHVRVRRVRRDGVRGERTNDAIRRTHDAVWRSGAGMPEGRKSRRGGRRRQ